MLFQRVSIPASKWCNYARPSIFSSYPCVGYTGSKGFTAIEFLLALAVASVLFISAVAGASQRNERLQIDDAARNLQLTMAFARNQAISRRSSIRVCPASEMLECSEGGNWNNGWLVVDSETQEVLRSVEPGARELQIMTDSGVSRFVQFNTLGDAYGTAGEFVVCHSMQQDYAAGLRVSAVGLVEHIEDQQGRCSSQS
jgi:type IV fimbrial biogenesis protein FimT